MFSVNVCLMHSVGLTHNITVQEGGNRKRGSSKDLEVLFSALLFVSFVFPYSIDAHSRTSLAVGCNVDVTVNFFFKTFLSPVDALEVGAIPTADEGLCTACVIFLGAARPSPSPPIKKCDDVLLS